MPDYTLQQAQNDIASLRGQIAHMQASAEFLQLSIDNRLTLPDGSVWTSTGLSSEGWIDYTSGFAWTATTTNPVLNNATVQTSYKVVGKTVTYKGLVVMGSTTTFGSGFWRISFPVTAGSPASTRGGVVGSAYFDDASAGVSWGGTVRSVTTSLLELVPAKDLGAAGTTSAIPMTWTVSDRFSWLVVYQIP